jgi:hypothetical protein
MEVKTRKIYERVYDKQNDKDNVYLGEFEVLQQLHGDENEYSELFVGKNVQTNKVYLIEGVEVCGFNGGTRYSCVELTFLNNTQI